MHYPVQLKSVNETLSLYLPIPAEIRPVYEKLLQAAPETPFPFWTRVWPASLALMAFLESNKQWVTGKNVVEIGAGTGLPSFLIARIAASVIISDHAAESVELMEKNISYLGLDNVKAMCLDWNHFPDTVKADTVLLSDINYAPEQFGPLFILIRRFLEEGTTVIIATPQRIMGVPFAEQLSPFILHQQEMMADATAISLFVLAKPK
jgi:predicted nicotinamide N-methyase